MAADFGEDAGGEERPLDPVPPAAQGGDDDFWTEPLLPPATHPDTGADRPDPAASPPVTPGAAQAGAGHAAAGPSPTPPVGEPETPVPEDRPPEPAWPPVEGEAGDRAADDDRRRRLRLGAIAVGVVAAGVALIVALSAGGGSGSPKGGPRLVVRGAVDQFNRPGKAKGLAGGSAPFKWSVAAGSWGIDGGHAYALPPAKPWALAVVDVGRADSAAKVRLATITNNAGIVFRYRDPENYWSVVALRPYATWAVTRTVKGNRRVVANTGLTAVSDGTSVGVVLAGDAIEVVVNDRMVKKLTDATLAEGATSVGMVTEDTRARFDDFTVSGAPSPAAAATTTTTAAAPAPAPSASTPAPPTAPPAPPQGPAPAPPKPGATPTTRHR